MNRGLRQFQQCKAIENQTIITEVIAIYRWGQKSQKKLTIMYIGLGQKSQKKLTIMHNTVYSTVYWIRSKE